MTIVVGVSSCSADMDIYYDSTNSPGDVEWGDYITAFGTVVEDAYNTVVVTDDGDVLFVTEKDNSISWEEVEAMGEQANGRVLINYSIVYVQEKSLVVRLNRIYDLHMATIESFQSQPFENEGAGEDEGDEQNKDDNDEGYVDESVWLGCDPAMPYMASLGGGYVNVCVNYPSTLSPDEVLPNVRLLHDNSASTFDTAIFYLCYEAPEGSMEGDYIPTQSVWFSFVPPDGPYGNIYVHCYNANIIAFQWCWWLDEHNYSAGYNTENVSVMYSNLGEGGSRWM